MTKKDDWGEECFYCDACGTRFRSPLYDIGNEFDQTLFFVEPRLSEIEVMGAKTIANYCSPRCRDRKRDELLQREKVRMTFPGIGPVEACSRCGMPVDMTKPHLTYLQMDTAHDWDRPNFGVSVLGADTLAIVCQGCEPIPRHITTALSWDEDTGVKTANEPVHKA